MARKTGRKPGKPEAREKLKPGRRQNKVYARNFQKDMAVNIASAKNAIDFVLVREGFAGLLVNVIFVGVARVRELNRKYLQRDRVTDVIAFEYGINPAGDEQPSGEIIICPRMAIEEAARGKINEEDELYRYVIHGALHAIGYEDVSVKGRRKMFQVQERYLEEFRRLFQTK